MDAFTTYLLCIRLHSESTGDIVVSFIGPQYLCSWLRHPVSLLASVDLWLKYIQAPYIRSAGHKDSTLHLVLLAITPISSQMASRSQPVYEWTARIEFNKFELNSSFFVHLFLGPPPNNPREWQTSPNLVGSQYAYVTGGGGGGGLEEGFVHLNHAIVQHSGSPSLEPSVVEPYLTRALQWRVQLVSILGTITKRMKY